MSQDFDLINSQADPETLVLQVKIQRFTKYAWITVLLGFAVLIFSIVIYFISPDLPNEYYALNLVGDFLGGILSSIWSLSGVFFLYVAFLGQRLQLLNQQKEIQLSIKEIIAQREEMAFQSITFERQLFENTFFNLIEMHQRIVSNVKYSERILGQESFAYFVDDLNENIGIESCKDYEKVKMKAQVHIQTYYKKNLDHYFHNFLQTLEFIKLFSFRSLNPENIEGDIGFNELEREKYYKIYFAVISSSELFLLFFWSRDKDGWLVDIFKKHAEPKISEMLPKSML
jgi:hypothetical protein